MNRFGSYTKFLKNAMQAIHASIEIYNKPQLKYREEICTVLLINAWELAIKSILSKNKISIYQLENQKKTKRKKKQRTLEFLDALQQAQSYFPSDLNSEVIKSNLEILYDYRNDIIHFYKDDDNRQLIYALMQTAIFNFRDLIRLVFNKDMLKDINWVILPLSFSAPPDVIEYFKRKPKDLQKKPLVDKVYQVLKDLEKRNIGTNGFLTQVNIKLESVRKSAMSDVTVGIDVDNPDSTAMQKTIDPNISHPFLRRDIIAKMDIKVPKFTGYSFDALAWKYQLKAKKYCWQPASGGGSPRYTSEVITLIKQLTEKDIENARNEYKDRHKKK